MADALEGSTRRILAANAADVEPPSAAGTPDAILDRLRLDAARVRGMADGLRDVAGLARPGRRGGPRVDARQRAGAAPGPRAVRRRRDHLRGPSQRHRRRRRDLPEERQRRAAARLVERRAVEHRDRACAARAPRPAPGCPTDVVQLVPGRGTRARQGADACPRAGRRADPAGRRRADPLGGRGVDRARDRDRSRQLPRVRRPRRRPRPGARDRAEREDPPPVRLQRRRVAARARRRGRRVPAAGGATRCRRPASPCTATRRFAALDGVVPATDEDYDAEYLSLDIAAAVVPDLDAAIAHIRTLLAPATPRRS